MLVHELTKMTEAVSYRLRHRKGIYTNWADQDRKQDTITQIKKKASIKHKKRDGFTERQHMILKALKERKYSAGVDLAVDCEIGWRKISSTIKPLVAKGLVKQCKKTKFYYLTGVDPSKFKKNTIRQKIHDAAKKMGVFTRKDMAKVNPNSHVEITRMHKAGLIKHIGNKTWQWIG